MVVVAADSEATMGNTHGQHEKPATVADLNAALASVKVKKSRSYYSCSNVEDFDEVYSGIWISSQYFAKSIAKLTEVGITHVLNCAEGSNFMSVNTGADYYKNSGIVYKGITAADAVAYDLSQHFQECCDFIAEARKQDGKILVHCLQGWSRSVTIVAAYLMRNEGLSAKKALIEIRSKREIHPNEGFLQLLTVFEARLRDDKKSDEKQNSSS